MKNKSLKSLLPFIAYFHIACTDMSKFFLFFVFFTSLLAIALKMQSAKEELENMVKF